MIPLCFVLIPWGKKFGTGTSVIDFDRVYHEMITPAIVAANMEPLRPVQKTVSGLVDKPILEQLLLCPFAVADLTLASADLIYEFGVRHASRPWSTVPVIAEDYDFPFDVKVLQPFRYKVTAEGVPDPATIEDSKNMLTRLLREARTPRMSTPIVQLLSGVESRTVAHQKTDIFRDQANYSGEIKTLLAEARKEGGEAVSKVERELGDISSCESGVVIDLFLSYRATKQFQAMLDLAGKMTRPLAATVLVREQIAFALNRLGRWEAAEQLLNEIIEERGASSETCSLLGRLYKDRWEEALKSNNGDLAASMLDRAIDAYLRGFEIDWRDAYPGINAVTLMEIRNPPDNRREKIIPVIRYSVKRKIATGKPDYWDYATLLELAVLGNDEQDANAELQKAVGCIREIWEPETTARNLCIIRQAREKRSAAPAWAKKIEDDLGRRSL